MKQFKKGVYFQNLGDVLATESKRWIEEEFSEMDLGDGRPEQTRGLGPLNYETRRGMYMHPTYAVRQQREPLGVCDVGMWAREARGADGARWPKGKRALERRI